MDLKNKNIYFKNFLSEEVRSLLEDHCKIAHKNNKDSFVHLLLLQVIVAFMQSDYGSFVNTKGPEIEKKIGVELFPTYSYWRMYTKYSYLTKHSDRPSCEYSVSVFIGDNTVEWPFIADGYKININQEMQYFTKDVKLNIGVKNF